MNRIILEPGKRAVVHTHAACRHGLQAGLSWKFPVVLLRGLKAASDNVVWHTATYGGFVIVTRDVENAGTANCK